MSQRQDSVTDQLNDLRRIAIREGMYDADDWIKTRLADPWDSCLDVDPFTGQPDHVHGDACEGNCDDRR